MEAASAPPPRELAALLDAARALLDRYEAVRADAMLAAALPAARAGAPAVRLRFEELACEAAFARGDYERALAHAGEALAAARRLEDGAREAVALGWSGAALAQLGRWSDALARLHPAVEALRAQGKEPLACRALNYLAVVQEELGDAERALAGYERAAEMARQAGDADVLGRALSNLGETYVTLGRAARARRTLGEALAVVEPRGNLAHVAFCRLALARLALDDGRDAEARALLEQAVEPAERSGAGRTLAEVLRALGAVRALAGERTEALELLQRALRLFEELGVQREVVHTHLALSEAYEGLGSFLEALRHHQLYARLRAGLFEEAARAQLASQAARHEGELARAQQEAEERLAAQARRLEELSRTDALTGLLNRRAFTERLVEEFERARRYRAPLTVGLVDVDGLKAVNEAHGRAAGDEVLRRVGALAAEQLRNVDIVARHGPEEIALLLPETPAEGARLVCEKLRAAVEAWPWEDLAPGLRVTVSVGLASGTELSGGELLLAAAEAQLYEAKRAGKNRVCGPG